jgi:hypothetical protein
MKQLRVIGLMLVLPVRGLEALVERPKAALAVLLLICTCIGAHLAIHSRIDFQAQKRITAARLAAEQPGQEISDEEVEKQSHQALNMKRIGGYVVYLVGIPLLLLILTLLFWLCLAAWGPGRGFALSYRMVAHAWLPLAVRQLLALPVIFSYPSIDPQATRGLFHSSAASILGKAAFPGALLLDPFAFWIGLLVYPSARAPRRGRAWSGAVGIVFWVLGALVIKAL